MESQKEHVQNHQPDYYIVHPMQKKKNYDLWRVSIPPDGKSLGMVYGRFTTCIHGKNLPTIGALQLCLFINHINYE